MPETRPADAEVVRRGCGRGASEPLSEKGAAVGRAQRGSENLAKGGVRAQKARAGKKAAAREKKARQPVPCLGQGAACADDGPALERAAAVGRAQRGKERRGQRRRKRRTQDAGARPHFCRSPPAESGGRKLAQQAAGRSEIRAESGPRVRYLVMRFFQATERMPSRMVQGLGGQPGT